MVEITTEHYSKDSKQYFMNLLYKTLKTNVRKIFTWVSRFVLANDVLNVRDAQGSRQSPYKEKVLCISFCEEADCANFSLVDKTGAYIAMYCIPINL